jgi:hypothetical protein
MAIRIGASWSGILALLATLGWVMHPSNLCAQDALKRSAVKIDSSTPVLELLPAALNTPGIRSAFFVDNLNDVAEVSFSDTTNGGISKEGSEKALEQITQQIAKISFLNAKKPDQFIELLAEHRPDLAGLPFLLNDTCLMKKEDRGDYEKAAKLVRLSLNAGHSFWSSFNRWRITWADHQSIHIDDRICVDVLEQILATEAHSVHVGLVEWLARCTTTDRGLQRSTVALARLAVFAQNEELRRLARAALLKRDTQLADTLLKDALRFPWPTVAQNAAETVVALRRTDLAGELVMMLEVPDPRAPVHHNVSGKKVPVVRELVRVNHLRNCLLCHPPGSSSNQTNDKSGPTGEIPIPGKPLPSDGYGTSPSPDLLVRADITYLRPDFSVNLTVAQAEPWPAAQRFDFMVRSRVLTPQEVADYEAQAKGKNGSAVYWQIALGALRRLTGRDDIGPSPQAWRNALGL